MNVCHKRFLLGLNIKQYNIAKRKKKTLMCDAIFLELKRKIVKDFHLYIGKK